LPLASSYPILHEHQAIHSPNKSLGFGKRSNGDLAFGSDSWGLAIEGSVSDNSAGQPFIDGRGLQEPFSFEAALRIRSDTFFDDSVAVDPILPDSNNLSTSAGQPSINGWGLREQFDFQTALGIGSDVVFEDTFAINALSTGNGIACTPAEQPSLGGWGSQKPFSFEAALGTESDAIYLSALPDISLAQGLAEQSLGHTWKPQEPSFQTAIGMPIRSVSPSMFDGSLAIRHASSDNSIVDSSVVQHSAHAWGLQDQSLQTTFDLPVRIKSNTVVDNSSPVDTPSPNNIVSSTN
jgi:hypothetical protein